MFWYLIVKMSLKVSVVLMQLLVSAMEWYDFKNQAGL